MGVVIRKEGSWLVVKRNCGEEVRVQPVSVSDKDFFLFNDWGSKKFKSAKERDEFIREM